MLQIPVHAWQVSNSAASHEGFGSAFDSLNGQRSAVSVSAGIDSHQAARGGPMRQDSGALEPGTVYRTPGSPSVRHCSVVVKLLRLGLRSSTHTVGLLSCPYKLDVSPMYRERLQ